MQQLLFPALLTFVALVIGIPSYFTWSRQWTGMIAGFDLARCTDPADLTRWLGATGAAMASVLLLAAALVWVAPGTLRLVGVLVAVTVVVGSIATMNGCLRFTRR